MIIFLGMKKIVEQYFKKTKLNPRVSNDMKFRIPFIIAMVYKQHFFSPILHVNFVKRFFFRYT